MEQSLFSLKTKVHYKAIVLCNAVLKKLVCKFTVYGKGDLNQQTVPSCVKKEKCRLCSGVA